MSPRNHFQFLVMYNPISTYRVQFNKDFGFAKCLTIIPYLIDLGVKTLYASPIFTAVAGSTHGYDQTDPHSVNPEIGTEAELFELSARLKDAGIGWIQDIVPNHMAFDPSNAWLMDVLKRGGASSYYKFFDISFPASEDGAKLMVPFLGEHLEEAIAQNKISIRVEGGASYICYADQKWPVSAESQHFLLGAGAGEDGEVAADQALISEVCGMQHYRLCHWQETESRINYRRFFTVNGLICLNIEDAGVFDVFHQYILRLLNQGIFQGLRVDHVDGLADPKQYLERLRMVAGDDCYIVVEKILGQGELLPADWPVQGNTGYDFLAMVNNLFTNRRAENSFDRLYQEIIGKSLNVDELVLQKKRHILMEHMRGELDNLVHLYEGLDLAPVHGTQEEREKVRQAIAELLVWMPVYRFYPDERENYRPSLTQIDAVLSAVPAGGGDVLRVLIARALESDDETKVLSFFRRCMQFSGPLMAKGVEDTLMYTYNRLIAHTEVGDAPDAFGMSTADFHNLMRERAAEAPLSMNATATHDTKRGEDMRARLNVLGDDPGLWQELAVWLKENSYDRFGARMGLHLNDAYFIFQTLIGALPLGNLYVDEFEARLEQYLEKALREAKKRSDWAAPNEEYEDAAKSFTQILLNKDGAGRGMMRAFLRKIGDFAILNSLNQLVLKCCCPGVPDIYQGTELWDFSFVDPDNRRPVDYRQRALLLRELKLVENAGELWSRRESGDIKLWLCSKLLCLRNSRPNLFGEGTYFPLAVEGMGKEHILAFCRSYQNQQIIVVLGLGLGALASGQDVSLELIDWKDTRVLLPENYGTCYRDLLSGRALDFGTRGDVDIRTLFSTIALTVLVSV